MQHDGNFVIYNGNWDALWHTGTHTHGASTVVVQQCDGNLVLGTATLRARGNAGATNIDVAWRGDCQLLLRARYGTAT